MSVIKTFEGRVGHISQKAGYDPVSLSCSNESLAGAVSQRACVYSGARVVLNPLTDALHLVHGPIGCASYTWDIRGSSSSGPDLYKNSFSTDMSELDVVYGGEKKLARAIRDLAERFHPPAIFVYSTCIVGIIGDDLKQSAVALPQSLACPSFLSGRKAFAETRMRATRLPVMLYSSWSARRNTGLPSLMP